MISLKILIVEDEIIIAELYRKYAKEAGHIVTGIAISYDEAVREFNLEKPDLILLDIRLYGDKSGIDFAGYVHDKDPFLPVIYLSSQYDRRTLTTALETNPFGYLTKPVLKESMWTSIEVAWSQASMQKQSDKTIEISDGSQMHHIKVNNILYIEADHVYSRIHLNSGEQIFVRKSIGQMLKIINHSDIVQCHRSYIVNIRYIRSHNAKIVTLENDFLVPVSRDKRKNLLSKG